SRAEELHVPEGRTHAQPGFPGPLTKTNHFAANLVDKESGDTRWTSSMELHHMSSQVKAEYDFEAQPGTGEMSITAGEILTVVR
ncbi:hypothetical protein OSTOST_12639, partial [Ostertagia ostertagi]